jgi:hypothetical protein
MELLKVAITRHSIGFGCIGFARHGILLKVAGLRCCGFIVGLERSREIFIIII